MKEEAIVIITIITMALHFVIVIYSIAIMIVRGNQSGMKLYNPVPFTIMIVAWFIGTVILLSEVGNRVRRVPEFEQVTEPLYRKINMEKKQTLATEARDLLASVPADEFIKWSFVNLEKCCSIGHLVRLKSPNPNSYEQPLRDDDLTDWQRFAHKVRVASEEFISNKYHYYSTSIASVNNRPMLDYQEEGVKDRVLHLLDDMIAAGY